MRLGNSQVAPAHEGVELGVGDAVLLKALAAATGRAESALKAEYHKSGDLGEVASACKGKQGTLVKPKPLTVQVLLPCFVLFSLKLPVPQRLDRQSV